MANTIDNFKSQLRNGGARANQYRVGITATNANTGTQGTNVTSIVPTTFKTDGNLLLCKGSSIPAYTIANVEAKYRGKTVNFAGEKTFTPWTLTFYNNNAFELRSLFEQWSYMIAENDSIGGELAHAAYCAVLHVDQMDRNGGLLRTYTFYNAYPTNVGEIALGYENENAIEEFDVEFTYDYFVDDTNKDSSKTGGAAKDNTIHTPQKGAEGITSTIG